MKSLLTLTLLLAVTAVGRTNSAPNVALSIQPNDPSRLYHPAPTYMQFALGNGGFIRISCATGEVTISDPTKLSQASLDFWRSLAKSYPEVGREMLAAARKAEAAKVPAKGTP